MQKLSIVFMFAHYL